VGLRLGSRGSALAVAQAELIRDRLEGLGEEVEVITIRTSGDERAGGRPAPETEDKARFVKEIEEALLDDRIDLAVHAAKDVPGVLPGGLAIVGVPERIDPRDALCGGATALAALPEGAEVGTASLRRRSQLLALRPDLRVSEVRGNVDTRLRKLADGDYDALVLASAGLQRLGRDPGTPIALDEMVPSPGQGTLALEARDGDDRIQAVAVELTDRDALIALTAERALVLGLDASCHTPVGAFARAHEGRLRIDGFAGTPDGGVWLRDSLDGDPLEPAALGLAVAERMLAAGAREILDTAERMDAG